MTERGHERPLGDENAGRRRVTHVVDQYLRAIDLCHASGVRVRQQGKTPNGEEGGGDVCDMGHHAGIYGNDRLSRSLPSVQALAGSTSAGGVAGLRLKQRSGRFTDHGGLVQIPGDTESETRRARSVISSPAV